MPDAILHSSPLRNLQIAVIIPALNEAGNIRRVVEEVRAVNSVVIIVVDNGSSDATAQEAKLAGAQVVTEPRRGYGYACAAGVLATNAEILVFMDGDGSFLAAEIPRLVEPIIENHADLVLGSRPAGRIAPGSMHPHQRFGNWLVTRLINALYSVRLTDLGPFRAIKRDLLIDLHMQEMTFGWPTEMMVKTIRQGGRICETPVCYFNRRSGHSKVSGTLRGTLLAARYILGVTLRYSIKSY